VTPWERLLSVDPKSCAGLNLIFMVVSPNPLRLPPRGPRDLDSPESTWQDKQMEKQLSFYYLSYIEYYIPYDVYKNNLYYISLYYISYRKLFITYNIYKKQQKNYSYFFASPGRPSPSTGPAPCCARSGRPRSPPLLALLPGRRPSLLVRGPPGLESRRSRGRDSGSR
jgi:hypothetical protein